MGIETFRYLSRGARCHSSWMLWPEPRKIADRSSLFIHPLTPLSTALYLPWKSVNETGQIGVVSRRSFQIASTLIGKLSGCPTKIYPLGWHLFFFLFRYENRGFMFDGANPVGEQHAFVRSRHHWPINSRHARLIPRAIGACMMQVYRKTRWKYEGRRKICISKSRSIGPCVAAHSTDALMTATTSPFCAVMWLWSSRTW